MYKLMVSYNAGITYRQEAEAKTVDELKPRGEELDRQWKRWTIEDEDGEVLVWCRIHNEIVSSVSSDEVERDIEAAKQEVRAANKLEEGIDEAIYQNILTKYLDVWKRLAKL